MSCQCTPLEIAAAWWWESKRPPGYTEAEHLADPAGHHWALARAADGETLPEGFPLMGGEVLLAFAVADLIKSRRAAAPGSVAGRPAGA